MIYSINRSNGAVWACVSADTDEQAAAKMGQPLENVYEAADYDILWALSQNNQLIKVSESVITEDIRRWRGLRNQFCAFKYDI